MLISTQRDPILSPATPGGASLDLDFRRGRASLAGKPGVWRDLLTFTRSSAALAVKQGGVLAAADANEPRIAADPRSGRSRGLLMEAEKTNLVIKSNDLTHGNWYKDAGIAVSANAEIAPDGTKSASRVTDSGVGTTPGVSQTIAVPNDVLVRTVSAYIKPETVRRLKLFLGIAGGATVPSGYAHFDFDTGRVFSKTGNIAAAGMEPAPLGYYRVWASIQHNGAGGTSFVFGLSRSATGDANGTFSAWGAGLTQAGAPTSVITTDAVAVTRAADIATLPVGSWFNPTEGTIHADIELSDGQEATPTLFAFRKDFSDYMYAFRDPTTAAIVFNVVTGGVSQAYITGYGAGPRERIRLAVRYRTNDFAMALRTGSILYSAQGYSPFGVLTDNTGALPVGLTNLDLGCFGTVSQLNGRVGRITYWPKGLSNGELSDLVA